MKKAIAGVKAVSPKGLTVQCPPEVEGSMFSRLELTTIEISSEKLIDNFEGGKFVLVRNILLSKEGKTQDQVLFIEKLFNFQSIH